MLINTQNSFKTKFVLIIFMHHNKNNFKRNKELIMVLKYPKSTLYST